MPQIFQAPNKRGMLKSIINYASNIQMRLFCALGYPQEEKKKTDDDKNF